MVRDKPCYRFGFGLCKPETRAKRASNAHAGTRMIFHPPLRDIVEKQGEEQCPPIADRLHNIAYKGKFLSKPLGFEFGEVSHRAQEVLVNRVTN